MLTLPGSILAQALAHLIGGQPWLRDKLVAFSGRRARIEVFPVAVHLEVAADGGLVRSAPGEADAVVALSPFTAMRLLTGDQSARGQVSVRGDTALAGALSAVLSELRWDVEEDLSRVVGDVAAHRIASSARSFAQWQRRSARDLMESSVEYMVEERKLLPPAAQVRDWARAVEALRDDVERLTKRIDRLSRKA